jgi:hypothetical protein
MYLEGDMRIVSLRPNLPVAFCSPYKITRKDQGLKFKGWRDVMNARRELLGSNVVRRPEIGDRWISILHNGDEEPLMFYAILPKREE